MKIPLTLVATLVASTAFAENDTSFFEQKLPAPTGAFEIALSSGFSKGSGRLERGVEVDGTGNTLELEVAYRLSPRMSIGWYGTFTDFHDSDTLGLSTGLQTRWHLRPFRAFDPWISAGGGLHAHIIEREMDDGDLAYLGFDLVRLQVGADFRFSPRLAVSPVIGMDVTTFVRTVDEWDYDQRIADKRLSVFFFAGLGGRFDFGGADVQPR